MECKYIVYHRTPYIIVNIHGENNLTESKSAIPDASAIDYRVYNVSGQYIRTTPIACSMKRDARAPRSACVARLDGNRQNLNRYHDTDCTSLFLIYKRYALHTAYNDIDTSQPTIPYIQPWTTTAGRTTDTTIETRWTEHIRREVKRSPIARTLTVTKEVWIEEVMLVTP